VRRQVGYSRSCRARAQPAQPGSRDCQQADRAAQRAVHARPVQVAIEATCQNGRRSSLSLHGWPGPGVLHPLVLGPQLVGRLGGLWGDEVPMTQRSTRWPNGATSESRRSRQLLSARWSGAYAQPPLSVRAADKQIRCSYRALDLRVICATISPWHSQWDRTGLDGALAALGDVLAYRGEAYRSCSSGAGTRTSRDRLTVYEGLPTSWASVWATAASCRSTGFPDALARAVSEVADAPRLAPDGSTSGRKSLLDLGLPPVSREPARREALRRPDGVARRPIRPCLLQAVCRDRPLASQDRHLDDMRALRPTEADLLSAARWSMTHRPLACIP